MSTFVFYAADAHARRADGRNTVVASGGDEAAARTAAEALIGQTGSLSDFRAVLLDDATPAFAVDGFVPVGARDQSVWPTRTRGGDFLPGV